MSNDVIIKEQNEVDTTDYYANVKIDLSDLIMPKITLMQKGSKKVEEEEAKVGEFRENVSNKLLGDKKTNLVIAPIDMVRKIYLENVKDKYFILEKKWYPPDGKNPNSVSIYEDDEYIEYTTIIKYLNKIIKKLKKKKEG